jgi:hypothetical protein
MLQGVGDSPPDRLTVTENGMLEGLPQNLAWGTCNLYTDSIVTNLVRKGLSFDNFFANGLFNLSDPTGAAGLYNFGDPSLVGPGGLRNGALSSLPPPPPPPAAPPYGGMHPTGVVGTMGGSGGSAVPPAMGYGPVTPGLYPPGANSHVDVNSPSGPPGR